MGRDKRKGSRKPLESNAGADIGGEKDGTKEWTERKNQRTKTKWRYLGRR